MQYQFKEDSDHSVIKPNLPTGLQAQISGN
jgi:hypothetical protein